MTWFRSLCIAFSMYSRIPVPYGDWNKEDMKYSIGLFPLVGAVIGALSFAWMRLAVRFLPVIAKEAETPGTLVTGLLIAEVLIACVIPLIVTGGIHVDGFMDTSDALHAWSDRAKRLQILSDPHIGAFSVLSLTVVAAFWVAAVSVIAGSGDWRGQAMFALVFTAARALSGLAAVLFQNARGEGTLWAFTESAGNARRTNLLLLCAAFLAAAAAMIALSPLGGAFLTAVFAALFLHYRWKAYREFGGITGDLEGWFLCRCEVAAACALALVIVAGRMTGQ